MTRRKLQLTAEHVAAVERQVEDSGPEDGYTMLTDDAYIEASQRFLSQVEGQPIRVFAYGSLIWKPGFDHVHAAKGRTHGWRRSFCMDIIRWRANPSEPGLMMAIDRGGCCDGVVFQLPDGNELAQMERLLRREASYAEDLESFRWLKVRTNDGIIPALTFYAGPRTRGYYINLPIEQQAARIARAAGHLGSNAAYLHNTIVKLLEHGIHDSYLWRLQELVAKEIEALHPHLGQ
jgi:glutathione-specific gamma-glutamylcyclotransferase